MLIWGTDFAHYLGPGSSLGKFHSKAPVPENVVRYDSQSS